MAKLRPITISTCNWVRIKHQFWAFPAQSWKRGTKRDSLTKLKVVKSFQFSELSSRQRFEHQRPELLIEIVVLDINVPCHVSKASQLLQWDWWERRLLYFSSYSPPMGHRPIYWVVKMKVRGWLGWSKQKKYPWASAWNDKGQASF